MYCVNHSGLRCGTTTTTNATNTTAAAAAAPEARYALHVKLIPFILPSLEVYRVLVRCACQPIPTHDGFFS